MAEQLHALKTLMEKDALALAQAQATVQDLRNANKDLVEHATTLLNRARAAETDLARIRAILDHAAPSRVFVDEADTLGFVPTSPSQLQTAWDEPTSPRYEPTSPSYSPHDLGPPSDEDEDENDQPGSTYCRRQKRPRTPA